VARYVAHHLGAAGLGFDWFTHEAIEEICTHSGGLPRTINLICERALRTAQQAGAPTVDAGLIRRSLAGESADGGAQSKGIVRTLLELPRPLLADAPRHEAEASTTETRPEEVGDLPANVAGPDRSRRIVRVGGATALVALAAGVLLYLGWWSPSPQAPKSSASSVIEQKVEPAPVEMPERPEPPVAAVAPPAPPRSAPAPNGERPRALAAEKTPQRPEPTIVPSFPPPSRAAAPSTEKAVTPERAIAQEKAVTPERPVTPERVVAPEKASAPERTGPQPPVPAPTSQLQARPTAPAVVRPPSPATDEPDPTAIIDWLLKQSPGRID
jgi:hypothetical protein